MKQLLTLLLAAFLGVLAVDACAQRGMPSKLFRQLLEHPSQFPRARLTELTDRQLTQLISCLEREKTRLTHHTQQERLRQARIFETSRLAVFRVLSQQPNGLHSLSGTLFKTQYAGETEVFGVVPMHVLQNKDHISGSISKQFTVSVQTEQGVQMIPAEVVQLSSSKTGDLALIKFRAQDEALLSPLSLANMPDQFPTQVYAQGFARSILTQSAFRLIGTTSTGNLLAQLPAARKGERAGFCGSPVLTKQGSLVGVHIGSNYLTQDLQETAFFEAFRLKPLKVENGDVGYISPVSFLRQMVAAYHNPALRPVVIKLAGQEITRLAVDEYVSKIELLDEEFKVVWSKKTEFKESFTTAETATRLYPQAKFVRLEIGKSYWAKDGKELFVQENEQFISVLKPLNRP